MSELSALKESTRKYLIKEMGKVHEVYKTLDKYDPELAEAVASLRKAAVSGDETVLPAKYRELIMIAVEVATGRGEKGKSHARKAVRAGASPREVQAAVAICLYLVGMSSWVDGGWESVIAAEEETERMRKGKSFSWSSRVKR